MDCSCTSRLFHIALVVLWKNIHNNQAISQSLCVISTHVQWHSMVHWLICLVFSYCPEYVTITPMLLEKQSLEIPNTARASWNALLGYDNPLKLTLLSLLYTLSQILLQVPSENYTWC